MSAPALPGDDPTPAALIAARAALRMDARDGLMLEGVRLQAIAAALGTPAWVYGANVLRGRYAALADALAPHAVRIHYAVKANDHLAVLHVLGDAGAGADVVSGGELARALRAGIAPERIVFSGVGKTGTELAQALSAGIAQINVESAAELKMLAAVARGMGRVATIALRGNPDVDAATHAKISTGRAGDKFGIPWDEIGALYARAAADPALRPVGIALHIGSQIGGMAPFRAAYGKAAALVRGLRAAGHAVQRLDCGGGLGICYRAWGAASIDAFAGLLGAMFGGLDLELMVEPGRWLAGPAGVLLARVTLATQAGGRRLVVLDAAMNDLLRPAMYDAWHGIVPVAPHLLHAPLLPTDVAGPICESSDMFARGRTLPNFAAGDVVAILDAGAYGAVMSSGYNARPAAAQALVDGERFWTIRPRQKVEQLWRDETVPADLTAQRA